MKKQLLTIKKTIFTLTFFASILAVQPVMAQEGFEDDVNDEEEPAAPIDDYIYYGLALGVASGLIFIKSSKKLKA